MRYIWKNYREQLTCLNCKFLFVVSHLGESDALYCFESVKETPLCGFYYCNPDMKDNCSGCPFDVPNLQVKLHECIVQGSGICDLWEGT